MESVIWVILIATFPVFDTDTVCVADLPTVTCPKLTLEGVNWKEAADEVCFAPLVTTPAHPFIREMKGTDDAIRNSPRNISNLLRTRQVWVPTVCA